MIIKIHMTMGIVKSVLGLVIWFSRWMRLLKLLNLFFIEGMQDFKR